MKYRHFPIAAAIAALAALPAVAAAQASTVAPSAQTGIYFGAGGGLSTANYSGSSFAPPFGTAWDPQKSAGAVKGFAGFRFHKYFGVEGGYYYVGKFTNDYTSAGGAGSVTSTLTAWMLDAVGYLPITPNISAIGRLGAVNGQIDNTSFAGTTPSNILPVSDNNTNFTWGLGAQFDLDHRWAFRAEYEYLGKFGDTNTGDMRINLWTASALFKF